MNDLEERNLVWNLLELIIIKNGLEIENQSLEPQDEGITFGDYVKGHPMSFQGDFEQTIIELERTIPSSYKIDSAFIFGTGEGHIGVMKIAP